MATFLVGRRKHATQLIQKPQSERSKCFWDAILGVKIITRIVWGLARPRNNSGYNFQTQEPSQTPSPLRFLALLVVATAFVGAASTI